jgi:threonyl-tRNA synthetase
MKILALHCDYLRFKPVKKALKEPEKLTKKQEKQTEIKEPLGIFIAVEASDEPDVKKTTSELSKNIKELAKQVKAKNIVLYPYAHLSSNLASPDFAFDVLKQTETQLKKSLKTGKGRGKSKLNIHRAPFGYYKQFELKCKGHPLAELSREIGLGKGTEKQKTKREESKDEKYDSKQLLRQISRAKLDTRKLKENDHRIIGENLDLFSFHDVAPGMVFWHNNGLIIFNELIKYWRQEHRKTGYEEVLTPQIMDKKIWQISGHWEKYSENNFLTEYEKRPFLIKPMNCPGGMLVYKTKTKSYKDLPLRVAELGVVHRQELSGVLAGLFRVVQFTQDDAHIFCKDEKEVGQEILAIINMIKRFYKKFKVKISHVDFSTRPEKRIGTKKQWDVAEKILKKVLKKTKMKFKINKGEGAFYGPKIDFHIKDSLGRT